MKKWLAAIPFSLAALSAQAASDSMQVEMMNPQSGEKMGTVMIEQHDDGVVFTPSLRGLEPGGHGFHVHENPSCDSAMKNGEKVPAGAAGSHYDPENTGSHGLPWSDNSHMGDLPLLYVGEDGEAKHPVIATRLTLNDVQDRALMIHAGGDNYSDSPEKLGGGGPRAACGVIK
ncbi:superoxide dismutase family protein [Salinimonas chungwhensis]|uniref:superoxide dismutase family protein n=1 Tax=Salinimonas chungwhensis TaxID=265425 RepID=UPI000380A02F|nr:superoxide dismutase family protein [Salinimonas chungwhensis]